jgi:hypothetical protein
LREKLGRQLKIDLDENESIHIVDFGSSQQPLVIAELSDQKIQAMVDEYQPSKDGPCSIQIRRLGEYVAKISLKGGYSVPLRFVVLRR